MRNILKDVVKEFSEEEFEKSAYVTIGFRRPTSSKKQIKKWLREILQKHKPFMQCSKIYENDEHRYLYENDEHNLEVHITPWPEKLENMYLPGLKGYAVWEESAIIENLKLIIMEKETKIKNHRHKYSKWWLAVVNHIGSKSAYSFPELTKIPHTFDNILIVSPMKAEKFKYLF